MVTLILGANIKYSEIINNKKVIKTKDFPTMKSLNEFKKLLLNQQNIKLIGVNLNVEYPKWFDPYLEC